MNMLFLRIWRILLRYTQPLQFWATQVKKGRSKKYIQDMYNDMVAIFDMPKIFGKVITMTDIMKRLEREYGIDFKRIHVHIESEQEFVKGVKK